ncbi:SHOCT domain-containing protein [Oryzihumus leptocrescens]|uniref:Putative oligomerization/nucleic acid binding protein n=1 Tax=Oryzihumus leptocrescens TaxID=297536 RepID=A0A542ZI58_9MICO|nr:SHOCT domain-containing protein [Oryzihumus leptocrescens]TQL60031.1 putative oligomerization/nucleic acid binding protein [Oryzihumus leptocrescens]
MGLIRGVARTAVVAGTASAVAGRVQRRQQRKWASQDAAAAPPQEAPPDQQQGYAEPPPPAPAPAPEAAASGGTDLVAQLQQLEQLHQQGAVNDEEFAAAKAKLLGG